MAFRTAVSLIHNGMKKVISQNVVVTTQRNLHRRANSTAVAPSTRIEQKPLVQSAVPLGSQGTKIIFNDDRTCDFKYLWLRDNCKCDECVHPETRQKLLDSPMLRSAIKPRSVEVTASGDLFIQWPPNDTELTVEGRAIRQQQEHCSVYEAGWLHKHGLCFARDTFEVAEENIYHREPIELWDRTIIWSRFPEISYREVMENDEGLMRWLEMIHKYGLAVIRDVPVNKDEIVKVVRRFTYVKETSYGITFDVICEPDPSAHLAYSGRRLELHTDMNYREKSPGLQLLHCLKSDGDTGGGKSFFVDGFLAAKWLQTNQPAAYHVLSSTPVKFSIRNKNLKYSQHWPILCIDKDEEVTEIHYNNRTMGPLQIPSHLVLPFYHAYRLLTEKLRDPNSELVFQMMPGDLVAFNNRRVLHGRTGFDHMKLTRHLQGCYVDIDEVMSVYDHLKSRDQPGHEE